MSRSFKYVKQPLGVVLLQRGRWRKLLNLQGYENETLILQCWHPEQCQATLSVTILNLGGDGGIEIRAFKVIGITSENRSRLCDCPMKTLTIDQRIMLAIKTIFNSFNNTTKERHREIINQCEKSMFFFFIILDLMLPF